MSRRAPTRQGGEEGVFAVVEAILVAVLVLTAVLFFTSVQRPTKGSESRGQDVGQVATDTLGILRTHQFNVLAPTPAVPGCTTAVPSGSLTLEQWVTQVASGECNTAYTVDSFLSNVLPSGTRYKLRLANGVDGLDLLPPPALDPGTPRGASTAQLVFLPHWQALSGTAVAEVATPGQALLAAANPVLSKFTDPQAVACVRGPYNATTTPGMGPAGETWAAYWQAQPVSARLVGTATSGSKVVTGLPGTSALAKGMRAFGAGLPTSPPATVASVDSGTQVTLSANAGAGAGTETILFSAPAATQTGTISAGGPGAQLVVASTAGIEPGMHVYGTGAATGPTVKAVTGATTLTLDNTNTPTGANLALTFWTSHVPRAMPYGTWVGYSDAGCTTPLTPASAAAVVLPGARTVSSGTTTTGSCIMGATSANAYSSTDIGRMVLTAGIPAGTVVTGVGRTVSDGATTNSGTTLASATAAFRTCEKGASLSGPGIPTGTTIASVTDASHVVMSAAATATASGVTVNVGAANQATLSATPTASSSAPLLAPDPTYPMYGLQLVVWFGA